MVPFEGQEVVREGELAVELGRTTMAERRQSVRTRVEGRSCPFYKRSNDNRRFAGTSRRRRGCGMGTAWPQGVVRCGGRAANGARRRRRPAGGRAPRGTGQETNECHTQEPSRGARTTGPRPTRTTRYDSTPTWCAGRSRARVRVPAPKPFGLARFDQVYLQIFELKCTNVIIPKL
jgi:hypothetical protein